MTELKNINEASIDPNVATTDENLSFEHIYQETSLPSLAQYVLGTTDMHGPTAALFNLKNDNGNIKLVRSEVQVFESTPINTKITKEAIEDLFSQYGLTAYNNISYLMNGISNANSNDKLKTFLSTTSLADNDLTLTGLSTLDKFYALTERINEIILKMNSKAIRTMNAFAIVPLSAASSLMSVKELYNDSTIKDSLYIGTIGTTNYFVSPFNDDVVYVGLKDKYDMSKCSGVYSGYTDSLVSTVDPNSGENTYHIFKRYAMTASPLHVAGNEMFYKFNIL